MDTPSNSNAVKLANYSTTITIVGILVTLLGIINVKFNTDAVSILLIATLSIVVIILISGIVIIKRLKSQNPSIEVSQLVNEKNQLCEKIRNLEINEKKLRHENEALTVNISKGMKIENNKVEVKIDSEKQKYIFTFEKSFVIISQSPPKKFRTQFYSNITKDEHLDSRVNSYRNIGDDVPNWAGLECYATLKYKEPGGEWSSDIELIVISEIDRGYHMPFNIIFAHYVGEQINELEFSKDTEVCLEYGYNVPFKFWGSYLNRTLSCFGEKASFRLLVKGQDANLPIILYQAKESLKEVGKKFPSKASDGSQRYDFDLPSTPFAKYVIYWNKLDLKGIAKSPVKKDDTIITDF
jgi:hypothetical protein